MTYFRDFEVAVRPVSGLDSGGNSLKCADVYNDRSITGTHSSGMFPNRAGASSRDWWGGDGGNKVNHWVSFWGHLLLSPLGYFSTEIIMVHASK